MPSRSGNLYVNALIGAVITVVTAFLPFSPVLGGAVAAYLEGGDRDRGLKIGAVSGVIASVPLALVVLAVLLFVPFVLALDPSGAAGIGALIVVFIVVIAVGLVAAYTVGLSALGGVLAIALLERERQAESAPVEREEQEG
jgi:hypothetical protein